MATKEAIKPEEEKVPHPETVHQETIVPTRTEHSKAPIVGIAIVLGLVILLIGAGSGFLAGLGLGKHLETRGAVGTNRPFGGQQAPLYQSERGQAGRGVSRTFSESKGTVTAISSDSISIKTTRGTTVTYTITSSTTVSNKGSNASVSDIKTGDTVLIRQTNDTTGDASAIELNP